jgi:predicted nucleic acid-binding protein
MRDRFFLDSNIIVYSILEDEVEKHERITDLLGSLRGGFLFISTQVINESYVSLLKNGLGDSEIQGVLQEIISITNIALITVNTIKLAWKIKTKYILSYWDSLIVASALESGCKVLYSEDMQHGQQIENTLTIKNPFIK